MCYEIKKVDSTLLLSFNKNADLSIDDIVKISHQLIHLSQNKKDSKLIINANSNFINITDEAQNYLKTNSFLKNNFKSHAYVTQLLSNRITAHLLKTKLISSKSEVFKNEEEASKWLDEINLN